MRTPRRGSRIAGATRTVHAYPLAAIGTWVAGALLYRGYHLRRRAKPERAPSGGPP